ncbi:MAG: amidohydrolase [Victivallales bacterium]|nr:amidohydrolase [Victivallales bacterium]MCF7889319.1 amidohydrolase [Victivallales bacterium]
MNNSYIEKIFAYLHQNPEKGFKEYKTSEYISEKLLEMGFKVERITGTGIKAVYDSGKSGPNFAVRADIDALPFITENNTETVIHACAHDAHTAIVLAAANKALSEGINKGKLILLFQPGEETGLGAESLIETGKLNDIDELVGFHLRPFEELKLGEATPALIHGGGHTLTVKVTGKATHAARPHLGVSSIDAAILAANAVNNIRINPSYPHSIKLTQFKSLSNADNTIPEITNLCFDIRASQNSILEQLIDKAKTAIKTAVKSIGAEAEIDEFGTPAADYDEELINSAKESITKVLGKCCDIHRTNGCDDFHHYTKKLKIKTAFLGIGADLKPGLHSPNMTFNHKAMEHGRDIISDIISRKL